MCYICDMKDVLKQHGVKDEQMLEMAELGVLCSALFNDALVIVADKARENPDLFNAAEYNVLNRAAGLLQDGIKSAGIEKRDAATVAKVDQLIGDLERAIAKKLMGEEGTLPIDKSKLH